MATVFLAEDLKHGCRVALKVLRPEIGTARPWWPLDFVLTTGA